MGVITRLLKIQKVGTEGYLVVKNLPASAADRRELGSIPGLERSHGVGNGNSLQYSFLENFMDRGAWWPSLWGHKESDTTEQLITQMFMC